MSDIRSFTYAGYEHLITGLMDKGYVFSSYSDWDRHDKCVILRHDIDYSVMKAERIAKIENDLGVTSTYFFLLTSDMYNVFSKSSVKTIENLILLGHDIGLHFDETTYPDAYGNEERIRDLILKEAKILEEITGRPVSSVSMHRPSKEILDAGFERPGMINSYGKTFFESFKYVSDSRRRWREPVDEIIESGEYDRLHILTHPFWYNDAECDIHTCVAGFVNSANAQRYRIMGDNITDISAIMDKEEIRQ